MLAEESDEQIELSEADLERELPPRVLTVSNPRAPDNSVTYSFRERAFLFDDSPKSLVMHFANTERLNKRAPDDARERESSRPAMFSGGEETLNNALRNQFIFCDRASETWNPLILERGVATQPPPSHDYNMNVSQCLIFDRYAHELRAGGEDDNAGDKKSCEDPVYSEEMKSSAKVMERILNQNLDRETFQDMKFFTDPADAYREAGSLLPLWRFESDKSRRKQVTCVKWNRLYRDLFAVSYGSYEFMKQIAGGVVSVYSLKNSKHPELVLTTEFTACCLDWNPSKPALLAVGVYDGTVAVMDFRNRSRKFIYQSTVRDSKHTDPVWEVKWSPQGDRFTSISLDGRACIWTMQKTKLECELLSQVKLEGGDGSSPTALTGLINGLCFDFSPHEHEDVYLIGTEEGLIHKCSRYFSANPIETFKGHSGAVYAVKWNPFHSDIFVSSSADWTVKVWSCTKSLLCSFDMSHAVGDVDWSPFSSCIFAAVNANGEIYMFDLHTNRFREVCIQKIISKGKLTKVCFNKQDPVILIGDDRGAVSSLKLSPNLHRISANLDISIQLQRIKQVIDILSD
jgi:dynein intermediate chain 1